MKKVCGERGCNTVHSYGWRVQGFVYLRHQCPFEHVGASHHLFMDDRVVGVIVFISGCPIEGGCKVNLPQHIGGQFGGNRILGEALVNHSADLG